MRCEVTYMCVVAIVDIFLKKWRWPESFWGDAGVQRRGSRPARGAHPQDPPPRLSPRPRDRWTPISKIFYLLKTKNYIFAPQQTSTVFGFVFRSTKHPHPPPPTSTTSKRIKSSTKVDGTSKSCFCVSLAVLSTNRFDTFLTISSIITCNCLYFVRLQHLRIYIFTCKICHAPTHSTFSSFRVCSAFYYGDVEHFHCVVFLFSDMIVLIVNTISFLWIDFPRANLFMYRLKAEEKFLCKWHCCEKFSWDYINFRNEAVICHVKYFRYIIMCLSFFWKLCNNM